MFFLAKALLCCAQDVLRLKEVEVYCGQQDGNAALGCARIKRESDSVPQQFKVALGFILLQHIIVTPFMQSHNAVLIHSWRA